MVNIVIKGRSFVVHKDILVKSSAYFNMVLAVQPIKKQAQPIKFDDIDPSDFHFYIQTLYQASLTPEFKLELKEEDSQQLMGRPVAETLLRLWQLSGRFGDDKLSSISSGAIIDFFNSFTVETWCEIYIGWTDDQYHHTFKDMQSYYNICKRDNLPFISHCVDSIANSPPQVFMRCISDLDGEFLLEVTKAFAQRYADPLLEARKRNESGKRERSRGGCCKRSGRISTSSKTRKMKSGWGTFREIYSDSDTEDEGEDEGEDERG